MTAPGLTFVVSPDPAIHASFQGIRDVGQVETFHANVTGGSGGVSLAWHQLPLECAKNGSIATCPIGAAGSWIINIGATDSNGFTVATPPLQVVDYAAQTVSLVSQTPIVDLGQMLAATGATGGGSGGTVLAWGGLPTGCAVPKAMVLVCRSSVPGNASLTLSVSDRANATVTSAPLKIEVAPILSLYLNASATALLAPAHVELTLTQTGGSRITAVNYHGVPPQCDFTSAGGLSCWGLPAGTYSTTIAMTDIGGGNATTTAHFVVSSPPPPSGPPPEAPLPISELLALAGIAIAAIALVAWGTRKRRQRGRPPA
ncbi:MAG: hypothetical protein L3J97_02235 [Thermoplasmata archaeon]|nr:hypothetical protein [Thermoplasmata archaeon]